MNELEFLYHRPFFTTREYASLLGKKVASASRTLQSYARSGKITKVTRGIWANRNHKDFSPYGAIPYLLANEQGCLSFLSALHRYGMISQIPPAIQIATTGGGRILRSPIGEFQFFRLKPELLRMGLGSFSGGIVYNISAPEKALLDTLYIATKKGRRFKKLPEVELAEIHEKRFMKWLKLYPLKSRNQMRERFQKLIKKDILPD
jgi:predicted transcriptional regulator of viral defense system